MRKSHETTLLVAVVVGIVALAALSPLVGQSEALTTYLALTIVGLLGWIVRKVFT